MIEFMRWVNDNIMVNWLNDPCAPWNQYDPFTPLSLIVPGWIYDRYQELTYPGNHVFIGTKLGRVKLYRREPIEV